MNYTKPEVAELGQAVRVIEGIPLPKGNFTVSDGPLTKHAPAYDLDE